jgi:hypothetical protein
LLRDCCSLKNFVERCANGLSKKRRRHLHLEDTHVYYFGRPSEKSVRFVSRRKSLPGPERFFQIHQRTQPVAVNAKTPVLTMSLIFRSALPEPEVR